MPDYPGEAGYVAKGEAYHYLAEAYLALATELGDDRELLQQSILYATKVTELHSLMTERFGSSEKSVSSLLLDTLNSESKSSSTM